MANHKSAVKRHRQNLKRAARNRHYRTTVKSLLKKARALAAEGAEEAEATIKKAISTIDKVKGKGIIPDNRASRYVSKLARLLQK